MADDVSPVVNRLKAVIETVANIGPVYTESIWDREDVQSLVVSSISGTPTLRAWWITGPRMTGTMLTQTDSGWIERVWTYQVHAIEGMPEADVDTPGAGMGAIATLRTNGIAVVHAIDADRDLANTCKRSEPCRWLTGPELRILAPGIGVAYLAIDKPVVTVTNP